jgi:hypothetical protein
MCTYLKLGLSVPGLNPEEMWENTGTTNKDEVRRDSLMIYDFELTADVRGHISDWLPTCHLGWSRVEMGGASCRRLSPRGHVGSCPLPHHCSSLREGGVGH